MTWHEDEETGVWTCRNADGSVRGRIGGERIDFNSPKLGGGFNYARWFAVVGDAVSVYAPTEAAARAIVEAGPSGGSADGA